MLEDEHPDWLDPITHCPLATMEPLEDYEEDCENAPEEIQKEIDENRRAWANCKDSWLVWVVSLCSWIWNFTWFSNLFQSKFV